MHALFRENTFPILKETQDYVEIKNGVYDRYNQNKYDSNLSLEERQSNGNMEKKDFLNGMCNKQWT